MCIHPDYCINALHPFSRRLWTLLAGKETKQIRKRGLDSPVEWGEYVARSNGVDTGEDFSCWHVWEEASRSSQWRGYTGLPAAVWWGRETSCSREELKCRTLTTSTRRMRSWEDERSRAGPVMRRLCWRDLIVAKDIMSHLHRHNEQELKISQIKGVWKSLISGSTPRKAVKLEKTSATEESLVYVTRVYISAIKPSSVVPITADVWWMASKFMFIKIRHDFKKPQNLPFWAWQQPQSWSWTQEHLCSLRQPLCSPSRPHSRPARCHRAAFGSRHPEGEGSCIWRGPETQMVKSYYVYIHIYTYTCTYRLLTESFLVWEQTIHAENEY